ncbi:MAG TPA: MFS transporter [Ktedonobacteraceae bacterium]|nr:MFS transporter [Ktedonobacteraceae bacterium]
MEISESSGEIATRSGGVAATQRVSLFEQMNINAFWIANNFHWQALLAIVLPSMVVKFLGDANKDINLALVVVWGTIVAVIVNPLVGALSDYATFRMGRRRPFMIVGTIFNVIALVLFAFAPAWFSTTELLITFILLFLLLQITNNVANAPWSAIIADKVPQHQRGTTAGFNGLFTLLGTAIGSIVAGLIVNKNDSLPLYRNEIVQIFLLIALVQIIFVIYTVVTVKETPLQTETSFELTAVLKRFLFNPTRYPDLSWVLLARLLLMMGIWGVFYFLQFYFDDVLGGPGARTILFGTAFSGEQFNGALFQPVLLLAALPTSLIAGWISDHKGRKGLVYLSGAVMSVVCLIFIFFPSQGLALVAGACFGIGYGAYSSVDWALTCDVLPPTDEAGKFLGLWSAMGIIPQVVGITVGAVILQALRDLPNHFGYTVLFLITVMYFGLGTIIIRGVKGVK